TVWLTWWVGDGQSILLITPFLLTWAHPPRPVFRWRTAVEVACLFVSLGIVSYFVLIDPTPFAAQVKYAIIFFFIWAALSLGPRATATAVLIVASLAIWACISGSGAFWGPAQHTELLLLQTFMTTISGASLAVAAVTAERQQTRDALGRSE